MEEIIKTLSEIDSKSSKIMDAANNEKQALELIYKKKKEDYKKEHEDLTTNQSQDLREQLNLQMQNELSKQSDAARNYLVELDRNYENNHENFASNIFNTLIQECE